MSDTASNPIWEGPSVHATRIDLDPLGAAQRVVLAFRVGTLYGAADLDGDGKDDLISNGPTFIRIDLMDGVSGKARGFIDTGASGYFLLEATRDMTGDGKTDLLFQDSSTIRIDFMDGLTRTGSTYLPDG